MGLLRKDGLWFLCGDLSFVFVRMEDVRVFCFGEVFLVFIWFVNDFLKFGFLRI